MPWKISNGRCRAVCSMFPALLIFQSTVVFAIFSAARDLKQMLLINVSLTVYIFILRTGCYASDYVGSTVCLFWTTGGCDVSTIGRSPGPGGRKRLPRRAAGVRGFSLPSVDMNLAAGYFSVLPFIIFIW